MKNNEQQNASMEDRILDEARKMFLEVGYDLTSTTEIARRVGCNQSMVHYYFRTKEQLFLKVFSQIKHLLFKSMESTLDSSEKDIFERIADLIEVHFDMLKDNQGLPFLVLGQVMTNPARRAELIDDFRPTILSVSERLQRELDTAAERGEITHCNASELITNIVSLNVGTFFIKPIICESMQLSEQAWDDYLSERKGDIIKCVLNSITIKS